MRHLKTLLFHGAQGKGSDFTWNEAKPLGDLAPFGAGRKKELISETDPHETLAFGRFFQERFPEFFPAEFFNSIRKSADARQNDLPAFFKIQR
jgi:hypothetical protein